MFSKLVSPSKETRTMSHALVYIFVVVWIFVRSVNVPLPLMHHLMRKCVYKPLSAHPNLIEMYCTECVWSLWFVYQRQYAQAFCGCPVVISGMVNMLSNIYRLINLYVYNISSRLGRYIFRFW